MIIKKTDKKLENIIKRGELQEGKYLPAVLEIIASVKKNGDLALLDYTRRFDGFEPDGFEVPCEETERAYSELPQVLISAMEEAADRIRDFHELQKEKSWFEEKNGILLGQKISPLDRVGVYVPGGKASYPSSVLMNIIPAQVAGVKEIIMTTPTPGGELNKAVLAAAKIAGATKIYRLGGAQAIAALAYGTESVPKVDKITGPGNIYVALAKKMVFGAVDIDMIAGPSEILVIADESANPAWVAADMLSQAEHDELASAVALTLSAEMAKNIEKELYRQLEGLKRKEIAKKSLEAFSAIIVTKNIEEACELANDIAPEHLELCVTAPMETMRLIRHAGAIFLGHHTPEACGDYFAGPNHVLPTGASARFFSPLGVYDFIKRSSLIYYSAGELAKHADKIAVFAETEGLGAHANSVRLRGKG